jgi:hypothetical protein
MIISSKYLEQSSEGGTNAIPKSFAFLAHRNRVARSSHGECKDVAYDVGPNAQRKDRAVANYESARPNDDLGANGHGVWRVSRQLRRLKRRTDEVTHVKNSKAAEGVTAAALPYLYQSRQRRHSAAGAAGAQLFLFGGGGRRPDAHQRRDAPDRGQRREVAGAIAEAKRLKREPGR